MRSATVRLSWVVAILAAATVAGIVYRNTTRLARCDAEADELSAWMHAGNAEGMGGTIPDPELKGLVAVEEKPRPGEELTAGTDLTLHGTVVLLDMTMVADSSQPDVADRIRAARTEKLRLWSYTHPGQAARPDTVLHVWLAPGEAWSAIAAALDAAARAGYLRAAFWFDGKTGLPAPPETDWYRSRKGVLLGTSIDPTMTPRVLPAADGGEAGTARSCPALVEALGSMSGQAMTPEEKLSLLADRMPPAIRRCRCNVDFDYVKDWYWRGMLNRYAGVPKVVFTVALATQDQADATRITAKRTDTWSDVSPQIIAASREARPISFVAE